jgi:hypothetical protein
MYISNFVIWLNFKCDQESGIKRAKILSDSHFKGIRSKVQLLKRTQEIAQQLEVNILIIEKKEAPTISSLPFTSIL